MSFAKETGPCAPVNVPDKPAANAAAVNTHNIEVIRDRLVTVPPFLSNHTPWERRLATKGTESTKTLSNRFCAFCAFCGECPPSPRDNMPKLSIKGQNVCR